MAGLGTGGTLTGVGRYLKDQNPDIKVVAAVPHPGDLVQGLRALEDGFIPPVLDESVLDGRIVVDSLSSFAMTKEADGEGGDLRRHLAPAPSSGRRPRRRATGRGQRRRAACGRRLEVPLDGAVVTRLRRDA